MQYTPRQYAHALYDLLETADDSKVIVEQFVKFLTNHNQLYEWPKIERALTKIYQKKKNIRQIVITSSIPFDMKKQNDITEKFRTTDELVFETNSALIGGVIITINNEKLLDASMRTRIKNLLS